MDLWTTPIILQKFPFVSKEKEEKLSVDNSIFYGGQVCGAFVDRWTNFAPIEECYKE